MTDFTETERQGSEASIVTCPDHYLVPFIELCKRSKLLTCGWSLIFIGLAIFCFFATNYMIDYPSTKARKIAFVFGGFVCLVAAASCLNLRFRILQECRDEPNDNVIFEIAGRDTAFSDGFSTLSDFEMHEMPSCHGTPREEQSRTETPEDSIRRAHSLDDPCFERVSTFRNNDGGGPPRKSISDGMTPATPLLPQRRILELSRISVVKSKRLQGNGAVSENNKYLPNYSTFKNGRETSDTEPLLFGTLENGRTASNTESLLSGSTLENGRTASNTESLLSGSTLENGRTAYIVNHCFLDQRWRMAKLHLIM